MTSKVWMVVALAVGLGMMWTSAARAEEGGAADARFNAGAPFVAPDRGILKSMRAR
ncbi:MAG: hypothetical protein FWD73_17885 [Polyangiaceae bacterium]|nr:hypothetical protein [Polyangiaceae bacterium]